MGKMKELFIELRNQSQDDFNQDYDQWYNEMVKLGEKYKDSKCPLCKSEISLDSVHYLRCTKCDYCYDLSIIEKDVVTFFDLTDDIMVVYIDMPFYHIESFEIICRETNNATYLRYQKKADPNKYYLYLNNGNHLTILGFVHDIKAEHFISISAKEYWTDFNKILSQNSNLFINKNGLVILKFDDIISSNLSINVS